MSVTLNNPPCSIAKNPNFKGSVRETENGKKYYHSQAGLAIASGFAGLNLVGVILNAMGYSASKDLPKEIRSIYGSIGKAGIITGLAAMAVHLGCGSIVDNIRNKEARKDADAGNNYIVTPSGQKKPVVQCDTGAKYGAILGASAGIINKLVSYFANRSIADVKLPILGTIVGIGISSLGGWLLGKWSDNIAENKSNEKLSTVI